MCRIHSRGFGEIEKDKVIGAVGAGVPRSLAHGAGGGGVRVGKVKEGLRLVFFKAIRLPP